MFKKGLSTIILVTVYSLAFAGVNSNAETSPSFAVSFMDSVARSVFTMAVVDREPVDDIDTLYTDVNKIFFFSDIRDMSGKTVTHRWVYNGKTMAEISFDVKAPRWRVYSSKNLLESWTGEWKVEVVDAAGNIIHTDAFIYLQRSDMGRIP